MHRYWMNRLNALKEDLSNGVLRSAENFYEAFEALFENEVRHNECDRLAEDWELITEIHLELIQRVEAIHAQEETLESKIALSETLNAETAFEKAAEGKRGERIYTLFRQGELYDCIGDLHSDPDSLMEILRRTKFVENTLNHQHHRLVFMGDYVDRGKGHLALLGRLLALKILFPESIYLLRGNHDGGVLEEPDKVKLPYRKPDDEPDEDYFPTYLIKLIKSKEAVAPLLPAYLDFFETLGQFALIKAGNTITMAVHGGVPRPILEEGSYYAYLNHLSELSNRSIMDPFGRTMVQNLMWSDPYNDNGNLREGMGRFYFTEDQLLDFIETIGVHQMLRGHEAVSEGYKAHFGNRVYTIFSSGQWPDKEDNAMTAYKEIKAKWARITPNGEIEIHPKNNDKSY